MNINLLCNPLRFTLQKLLLLFELPLEQLREAVQVQETYKLLFGDSHLQLIQEALLLTEIPHEIDHIIIDFLLAHSVNVLDLFECQIYVCVISLHLIPRFLVFPSPF